MSAERAGFKPAAVVKPAGELPPRETSAAPAGRMTHSTDRPDASSTRRAAAVTSGPIPSPGIRTIVCFAMPGEH